MNNYSTVYFDSVSEVSLDRAVKLLSGISGGVYRAAGSALKRAAQHGLTIGMRIASEEYAISQGELKSRTQNIRSVSHASTGGYQVSFGYRGRVIPLIRFDTKIGSDGRVYTRVLRSSAREALDHAFVAQMNGHTGVFEREGPDRFPVKELFGPSAVSAFNAHEETVDKMESEILETYEQRLDHEITRLLNGWGG